jgi:hypothetical protein
MTALIKHVVYVNRGWGCPRTLMKIVEAERGEMQVAGGRRNKQVSLCMAGSSRGQPALLVSIPFYVT